MKPAAATVIVGVPGTGKSRIVKELLTRDVWDFRRPKWVPHHISAHGQAIVLGNYDDPDHQFAGTDRMSMACQAHVLAFLERHPTHKILAEGDRLGNRSFIEALLKAGRHVVLVILSVQPTELARRRTAERDQSETFLASRATKIANLEAWAMHENNVSKLELAHNTAKDTTRIVEDLRKTLKPYEDR